MNGRKTLTIAGYTTIGACVGGGIGTTVGYFFGCDVTDNCNYLTHHAQNYNCSVETKEFYSDTGIDVLCGSVNCTSSTNYESLMHSAHTDCENNWFLVAGYAFTSLGFLIGGAIGLGVGITKVCCESKPSIYGLFSKSKQSQKTDTNPDVEARPLLTENAEDRHDRPSLN